MQEGSITKYQLKSGRPSWGYYIRLRDENGKLRAVAKQGFATKGEAQQARDLALKANGGGPPVFASAPSPVPAPAEPEESVKPLFSELLKAFLSDAAMNCSLGTLEAYRKQSRYPLRQFGDTPVDTITTEDLQKLFTTLRTDGGDKGRPLSPKTLKHIRFLVKCVLDFAVKLGHVAASPLTKDVRTPKLRKKRFKMPEKQRLKDVIQQARGLRLYPSRKSIVVLTRGSGPIHVAFLSLFYRAGQGMRTLVRGGGTGESAGEL